mgnify:FL=1
MKHIAQLDVGESAILGEMKLPEEASARLEEMCFLPGAAIRLVRRAPLGCPIEFEVAGTRLAIREVDAANILVG